MGLHSQNFKNLFIAKRINRNSTHTSKGSEAYIDSKMVRGSIPRCVPTCGAGDGQSDFGVATRNSRGLNPFPRSNFKNRKIMSKYSEYTSRLSNTTEGTKEILLSLTMLKKAKRKRSEPVQAYVGNKLSNIKEADILHQSAMQHYDLGIQDIKISDIISTDSMPTFSELVDIAETVDPRDV